MPDAVCGINGFTEEQDEVGAFKNGSTPMPRSFKISPCQPTLLIAPG